MKEEEDFRSAALEAYWPREDEDKREKRRIVAQRFESAFGLAIDAFETSEYIVRIGQYELECMTHYIATQNKWELRITCGKCGQASLPYTVECLADVGQRILDWERVHKHESPGSF